MIPDLSWHTPNLSLRVPNGCSDHGTCNGRVGACHDRVGIIFFIGMLGSVWGSSRTETTGPYVIPRPGVPRHIDKGKPEKNYDLAIEANSSLVASGTLFHVKKRKFLNGRLFTPSFYDMAIKKMRLPNVGRF